MKKIRSLLILVLALLMCACSNTRESISGAKFNKIATKNEYTVTNVSEIYDYAKSAYIISNDNYKIMFIEGKKIGDIQSTYTDEVNNIYKKIYADNKKDTKKGEKWSILELEDADNYYYIAYINKTLIQVSAKIDSKDEIIDLLKKLTYYK